MTMEFARAHVMQRPWGVMDCGPWLNAEDFSEPIGEIWFDRPAIPSVQPALLLKLLFTSQPLSIQVHPGDAYARSKGMANGKTEAWYVLSAAPGAAVAVGLDRHMTASQLRRAVEDGSIADHAAWQDVSPGDAVLVPAGTIHAIGAGLVIAEIQQRSDTTYRLFDHGRQRELHIDDGIAVAEARPANRLPPPIRLTCERTMLVGCPHFVFERMEFIPDTDWRLEVLQETWLLVIAGHATANQVGLSQGDTIFAQSDRVEFRVGNQGCVALVAYASTRPLPDLLQRSQPPEQHVRLDADRRQTHATTISTNPASADRNQGIPS